MEVVDRDDLPDAYREDLEVIEDTIGRLSQRELYVFKMAKDFERLFELDGGR